MVLEIPVNEYYEYFGPDYELDVKSSNTEDLNTRGYLERVTKIVMENLRHIGGPPSVQLSGGQHSIFGKHPMLIAMSRYPTTADRCCDG
jgi:hypothetical protein